MEPFEYVISINRLGNVGVFRRLASGRLIFWNYAIRDRVNPNKHDLAETVAYYRDAPLTIRGAWSMLGNRK